MNVEHHRWHSPALDRDMSLLVFGHAGARVLVFPTSLGTCREWPDRRMHEVLGEHISSRAGSSSSAWTRCTGESWYGEHLHPGARAWRHLQYDRYLLDEVLPFTAWPERQPVPHHHRGELRGVPRGLLRLPPSGPGQPDHRHERPVRHQAADRRLLRRTTSTAANPSDFIRHEHDPGRLDALRRQDIILAIGRDDPACEDNRGALGRRSGSKGIGNALRIWDGWAHDWPYWERMIRQYIGGHD